MKFRIVLILLLCIGKSLFAAFPAKSECISYQYSTYEQPRKEHSKLNSISSTKDGSSLYGYISFGTGLAAFGLFLTVVVGISSLMVLIMGVLALFAIVLGIIGFNKPNRGFAITGFILGILALVPMALIVAFLTM